MSKRKPLPTFTGHRKALVNLLKEAAYNRNTWEVFNDFTQLAALSFANASDSYQILNGVKVWNDRKNEYQHIVNKYNAETRELFPKMLAELVDEFQDNSDAVRYMDVLGEIFEGLGFNNEWRGQYFTPLHIAEMTAKITLNDKVMCEKLLNAATLHY